MIRVTDIQIVDRGDSSTGASPSVWNIDGTFYFSDEEAYDDFYNSLWNTFAMVATHDSCLEIYITPITESEGG